MTEPTFSEPVWHEADLTKGERRCQRLMELGKWYYLEGDLKDRESVLESLIEKGWVVENTGVWSGRSRYRKLSIQEYKDNLEQQSNT